MAHSMFKIAVQGWPSLLTTYVMSIIATYLTGVWKLSLTHAATIVNLYSAAVGLMPVAMKLFVDGFMMSSYRMLWLSRFAFVVGLGLLTLSTPPFLAGVAGNCSAYKPECIEQIQKILLYTSLPLIAFGMSGHEISLPTFMGDNLPESKSWKLSVSESESEQLTQLESGHLQPPETQQFRLPSEETDTQFRPSDTEEKQLPPSIETDTQFRPSDTDEKQLPPSIETDTQFQPSDTDEKQLPSSIETDTQFRPSDEDEKQLPPESDVESCICDCILAYLLSPLPTSAIIAIGYIKPWSVKFGIPSIFIIICTLIFLSGKGSYKRIRAHRIPFTWEETKIILRMIPVCMFVIVVGAISSIGNTYFIEQATDMNPYVGKLSVPILILPYYQQYVKTKLDRSNESFTTNCPKCGIAWSMVFAVLCCITAAKVEARRLGVVESRGYLGKPGERIPMTMFWLLPQFLLLGLVEYYLTKCIVSLFNDRLKIRPKKENDIKHVRSMLYQSFFADFFGVNHAVHYDDKEPEKERKREYVELFGQAVRGVGIIGGVLLVYAVDLIQPTWFQDTINRSRLDNYYWTLAVLSAANLVLYVLLVIVTARCRGYMLK